MAAILVCFERISYIVNELQKNIKKFGEIVNDKIVEFDKNAIAIYDKLKEDVKNDNTKYINLHDKKILESGPEFFNRDLLKIVRRLIKNLPENFSLILEYPHIRIYSDQVHFTWYVTIDGMKRNYTIKIDMTRISFIPPIGENFYIPKHQIQGGYKIKTNEFFLNLSIDSL